MALNIEELRKPRDGAMYVSPERLCLTADGELCSEDDPKAVKLLVGKGGEISTAEATKYGLIADGEPQAAATPPESPEAQEAPGAPETPASEPEEETAPAEKRSRRR
jgi:hypothetical protein